MNAEETWLRVFVELRQFEIIKAMCIAANSNNGEIAAKFVVEAVRCAEIRDKIHSTQAALHVFEQAYNFLGMFEDEPRNKMIPRCFFGGILLGFLRQRNDINLMPLLKQIALAPMTPPFLLRPTCVMESEIAYHLREWTSESPERAKRLLAEIKKRMEVDWRKYPNLTPTGIIVVETMSYALFARVPMKRRVKLALMS